MDARRSIPTTPDSDILLATRHLTVSRDGRAGSNDYRIAYLSHGQIISYPVSARYLEESLVLSVSNMDR